MNCSKCGKEIPSMIIINTNAFTLAEYSNYKENGQGQCIKCFSDKKENKRCIANKYCLTHHSGNVEITDSKVIINGMKNNIIKIIGRNEVEDTSLADALKVKLTDENGSEHHPLRLVRISKLTNDEVVYFPARVFYSDISKTYLDTRRYKIPKVLKDWYRFKKTVILNEDDKLMIEIVEERPDDMKPLLNKISKDKVELFLECTIEDMI